MRSFCCPPTSKQTQKSSAGRLPGSGPMRRPGFALARILVVACWVGLGGAQAAGAGTASVRHFEIPAGDAEGSLRQFSQQAGVELVFSVDKVEGVVTHAVSGNYAPLNALSAMLAGTGLTVVVDPDTGALAVNRESFWTWAKGPEAKAPADAPSPNGAAREQASPTPADAVVRLPEFAVSGSVADAFRIPDTVSGTRIRGQLLDTPMSVAVISNELIRDVGADSMYDATRYFSGVSNGRGTGPGGILDRQDFRGFESFSRTVDGLSTFLIPGNIGFQANFDPQFIERIEIVKGPDSILAPTGSPGGSINVITKSPRGTPSNDLTVQMGNYNAGKVTVDSTGPLPGAEDTRWTYRVIGDYQDARTYVPGSIRQSDLSLQLRYQFTDSSAVTIKYFGQQWELTGAIADPNDNGWYVTDPTSVKGATLADTPAAGSGFTYDGWNGDTPWSHRLDRVNMLTAEFTRALWERISMRIAASVLFDNFNQDVGYLSAAAPAESWDPATGQEIAIAHNFNPASAPEIANHIMATNRDEQVQNDYAANFNLSGVTVQPVAGWTYQQGTNPSSRDLTAPLPDIDLLIPDRAAPAHPPDSAYSLAASTQANARQAQVYGLLKTGFYGDRVFLLGGASRLWTRSASSDHIADNTVVLDGQHDTYLGGILAKPASNFSVYYLFSSNAAITNGPDAEPVWQTGRQNEFGAKSEFFDQRLSLTLAHFQITESNLSSPNPLYNTDPANNPLNILTNEANHGEEFEMVGALTRNLSIIASHTQMRLRDAFGRRLRNVPDTTSALLLEYRFLDGPLRNLDLFAGAVHDGNSAGETVTGFTPLGIPEQPGFYVAPWTVYNAGLGYRWGRYHFNLNVDNLLDSRFVWQPTGRNSVSPYPGTTGRLTVSIHF
jgi:iron complex outermembrane receptor protein